MPVRPSLVEDYITRSTMHWPDALDIYHYTSSNVGERLPAWTDSGLSILVSMQNQMQTRHCIHAVPGYSRNSVGSHITLTAYCTNT